MKILIETLVQIITVLIKGVFDLIGLVFSMNKNDRLHQDSPMSGVDKWFVFYCFHKGLVVNGKKRISTKQTLTHALIVGKSGIGKTSAFYLPNLLRAKTQSFVVTDLDGAMYKASSGYLKKQGYDIQVLDFANVQQSAFFNPIAFCNSEDDLKSLAENIVFSSDVSKNSQDNFWSYSSSHLLYFLLRLVKTQEECYQNLSNVRHLLNLMETQGFKEFISENVEGILFSDYLSFHSKDVKLRTNIQASLSAIIDLFTYSEIAHITAQNTLDFALLTKPKSVLFVIVPEKKLKNYALILSLFYTKLFGYVQENPPKQPVRFLLDEAGNFYIKDLEILLSILRRYNCSLSLGLQDLSQLKNLYGDQASKTIINNTSTKIIFPGASLELATEISRISGQKTVDILFEGKTNQQTKSVFTVTEIIQMPQNKALFLISNHAPVMLKMHPYYKQYFSLKRRSKLKPIAREETFMIPPVLMPIHHSKNPTHEKTQPTTSPVY